MKASADGFVVCRNASSDYLPHFRALPHQESDFAFFRNLLSRIIVAFSTIPSLHQFPSPKRQEAPIMWCKGQIPGEATRDPRVGRVNSHRIVLREANVESGLSLQTRRELLQQVISQYREATTVKKKSKLLDAFTV
jgi:hypothetical protein